MKKSIDFVKIIAVVVLFMWVASNLFFTYRKFLLSEAWLKINSTTPIFHKLDELEDSLVGISGATERLKIYKQIADEQHEINVLQGVILSASDKEITDLIELYDKK